MVGQERIRRDPLRRTTKVGGHDMLRIANGLLSHDALQAVVSDGMGLKRQPNLNGELRYDRSPLARGSACFSCRLG